MRLTLPYPPSVNHYWQHVRGRAKPFVGKAGKAYRLGVRMRLLALGHRRPFTGPVVVRLWLYRPRNWGDIDNPLKALFDALKPGAWTDDSQIVELHIRKGTDPDDPRVEVEVEPDVDLEAA